MMWLLNIMEEKIDAIVMFFKTAKDLWDTLKEKEIHSKK